MYPEAKTRDESRRGPPAIKEKLRGEEEAEENRKPKLQMTKSEEVRKTTSPKPAN